jgi:hypothetical protein
LVFNNRNFDAHFFRLDGSKSGFEIPIDDGGFGGQVDEALFGKFS